MSTRVDSSSEATYSPPSQKVQKTSFWKNVFVGSLSGTTAVLFIQPMIYFKNLQQAKAAENKSIPMKISSLRSYEIKFKQDFFKNLWNRICTWYRGGGVFAAGFAPTIVVQMAASDFFLKYMNQFNSALAGGMASSIVVSFSEGVMIQQQKTGNGFCKTVKHIYSNYGLKGFFRAIVSTGIRETIFAGAYLGGVPILNKKLQSYGVNEWLARLISGVSVGVIAAAGSHPFDTYKTRQQNDFSVKLSFFKDLFHRNAFAGFGWRAAMVSTATTVMPVAKDILNKIF